VKVGPMMIWEGHKIGAGSNSAFQAANLAVRWGASRIILLGVDCHSPGKHWHSNHTFVETSHQKQTLMHSWMRSWTNASKDLAQRGVEVVNCSPGTALDAFPKMTIEHAVKQYA